MPDFSGVSQSMWQWSYPAPHIITRVVKMASTCILKRSNDQHTVRIGIYEFVTEFFIMNLRKIAKHNNKSAERVWLDSLTFQQ